MSERAKRIGRGGKLGVESVWMVGGFCGNFRGFRKRNGAKLYRGQ